jgi:hypothetical protein
MARVQSDTMVCIGVADQTAGWSSIMTDISSEDCSRGSYDVGWAGDPLARIGLVAVGGGGRGRL